MHCTGTGSHPFRIQMESTKQRTLFETTTLKRIYVHCYSVVHPLSRAGFFNNPTGLWADTPAVQLPGKKYSTTEVYKKTCYKTLRLSGWDALYRSVPSTHNLGTNCQNMEIRRGRERKEGRNLCCANAHAHLCARGAR